MNYERHGFEYSTTLRIGLGALDLTTVDYRDNRRFRQQVCKVKGLDGNYHGLACNCGVRGSCNARKGG